MTTINFKDFAWNLMSVLTDITYVEMNKAFEEMPEFGDNGGHDEYIKWSVLKEQAHEAWCEVEDILEEIHFKEDAWQERIQREDGDVREFTNAEQIDEGSHYTFALEAMAGEMERLASALEGADQDVQTRLLKVEAERDRLKAALVRLGTHINISAGERLLIVQEALGGDV